MPIFFNRNRSGFVMLYAILLVSIVLVISLSLFDISYRQILLSSTVEASQLAFYAAVSARDCVRFWDNYVKATPDAEIGYYFGRTNPPNSATAPEPDPNGPQQITCATYSSDDHSNGSFDYYNSLTKISSFVINYSDGSYASVSVKHTDTCGESIVVGSNTPPPTPPNNNLRRLETKIRTHIIGDGC